MAFQLLHAFTVFSSFLIIIGDVLQRTAAATIDQLVTDGGKFVKRIVHGEKITEIPGYLLFTAPLKLCEGGCEGGESNFAMAFPIYIGKKGVEKYKDLYNRDYKNLHLTKPYAPFKKRPTKKVFTLCPNKVTKEQTTLAPTTTPKQETTSAKSSTQTLTDYETETYATEAPMTSEEIETTIIKTPFNFPITKIPSDSEIERNTTPATETEVTVFKILTKPPTNPPVTEGIFESDMFETNELTRSIDESILNYHHLPVHIPLHTGVAHKKTTKTFVNKPSAHHPRPINSSLHTASAHKDTAKTVKNYSDPNAKTSSILKLETNPNTAEMFETETPKITDTKITETEDITFESSEYNDNKNGEDEKYNYVTNAKGLRCPLRICQKKKRVTAEIIFLKEKSKDSRNVQWNSDYSDFSDPLDSRDFS